MKTKITLMILALSLALGQLSAQNSNFRFATSTTTNQVIDTIRAIGVAYNVPFIGTITDTVSLTANTIEDGNIIIEKEFYINTNTQLLDPIQEKTNTYNGDNFITTSTIAKWNTSSSQYIDSVKYEYEYPINDLAIQSIYEINAGIWVLTDSVRIGTTYNANQDPTEKITSASSPTGLWVDSLKETTLYDASSRFTEKVVAQHDGSDWVNFKKVSMVYSTDGKTSTAIFEDWDNGAWVAATFSFEGFPATLTTTMSYSMVNKTAVPVIENAIETVKTYPNPTVDGFYVKAGVNEVKVEVITVKGELLINKVVTGTEYIRVNDIGKGTFLVRLSTGGKSVTKKLFVK